MSRLAPRKAQRQAGSALAFVAIVAALSGVPSAAPASSVGTAVGTGGGLTLWGSDARGQTTLPSAAAGDAFTAVAAGADFTVALTTDGQVVSWGDAPQAPTGIGNAGVVAIAAGGDHALALTADGGVIAWGGQTGVPAGLTGVTAIAAGDDFDLALTSGGDVVAWGADADATDVPASADGATAIAAGGDDALAVVSGHVVGWGSDSRVTGAPSGLTDATDVAVGAGHALALREDGTVSAWGSDSQGQTDVPSGLSDVTAIAAGGNQSIALDADGSVTVWGDHSHGQSTVPTELAERQVTAIAAGDDHLAALANAFVVTPAPQVEGSTDLGGTLTVDAGEWTPEPDSLTYQWSADGTPIDGATGDSLTMSAAELGRAITVTVTAHLDGYPDTSVTSDATAVVTGGTFTTTVTPAITGAARVDSPLHVVTGTWDPPADGYGYQWSANGAAITGATGDAFTPTYAQLGQTITVSVTALRAGYAPVTQTSAPTSAVSAATFTQGSTPAITGTAAVGRTLTAANGSWSPAPDSYGYQWFSDGDEIAGATTGSLTLDASEAGSRISVDVTARRGGYVSSTRASAQTAVVTGGEFTAAPAPVVSGSTTVGGALTADAGTWAPTPDQLGYQWYADGVAISGATASTLTTGVGQLGHRITVTVTATRPGYSTVSTTSAPTAMVDGGVFAGSPVPQVSGDPLVGHQLTAAVGLWDQHATLAFQWYADGVAISGATGQAFTPGNAQVGARISVQVTGSAAGYVPVAEVSVGTGPVGGGQFTLHPQPVISGVLSSGEELTAVPGTWYPAASLGYRWYVGSTLVEGATGPTFTPDASSVGQHVTVVVVGTRDGYATAEESHTTHGVVGGGEFTVIPGSSSVTGSSRLGGTLAAPDLEVSPAATVTWQWYAGAAPIRGATGRTLTTRRSQLGKRISVRTTASRAGYASVARTSSQTRPVGVFWRRSSPTVTGTARLGRVLRAHAGAWSPEPGRVSYQWYADGVAIKGATGASYRVTAGAQGRKVTVRVTVRRSGYLAARRSSAGVWIPHTGGSQDRFR